MINLKLGFNQRSFGGGFAAGAWVGAGLVVLVIGCAGELEDPASFLGEVDRCTAVTQALFQNSCLGGGCHSSGSSAGGLDLESDDLEARMLAQPSNADGCQALSMVNPADPLASYLYIKMTDTPQCLSRMPLGGGSIPQEDLDCVAEWIGGLEEP